MVKYVGSANDPLAQPVEHLTFNQGVRSSNLRWITKIPETPCVSGIFFALLKKNAERLIFGCKNENQEDRKNGFML